MTTERKINRRQFIAATGAAALAACAPDGQDKAATDTNVFRTLGEFSFRGQDGEKVNMRALGEALRNKHTTLTFSFSECTQFCPVTDVYLSMLDQSDKNLTHIIIAVDPMADGGFAPGRPEGRQNARDNFMKMMRDRGITNNIVILYPPEDKVTTQIAESFHLIVNRNEVKSHSPAILLFEPGGKLYGVKSGIKGENMNDWMAMLASKSRGADAR